MLILARYEEACLHKKASLKDTQVESERFNLIDVIFWFTKPLTPKIDIPIA